MSLDIATCQLAGVLIWLMTTCYALGSLGILGADDGKPLLCAVAGNGCNINF